MFETICRMIPRDPDYPERTRRLDILTRVLEGRLHDVLPHDFHEERTGSGEYIPLRSRRPSVRYALPRIVVDDSLSLVFGDGHFPTIECDDATARTALADIVRDSRLNAVMLEAALRGSVGSVAILLRVLSGRAFFSVLPSTYLTPEWDPAMPDRLLAVTERYKATGAALRAQGYDGLEPGATYWFVRRWDDTWERWFLPLPLASQAPLEPDEARSVRHALGFVPIAWIRNLPGGEGNDGASTFGAAIHTSIEIDYQLSQAGRGLKYSSDPTLLIREPAAAEADRVGGAANALVVGQGGDAKLLEISGAAAGAVIDYVRVLRELALESVHGNRAGAERIAAPMSGRALEMMHQGLIFLADNLRVSYGAALLELAGMVLRASARYPLWIRGAPLPPLAQDARLSLRWPRWWTPDAEDRAREADTLATLIDAGVLSRESATKSIADDYALQDVARERDVIAAERAAQPNAGANR